MTTKHLEQLSVLAPYINREQVTIIKVTELEPQALKERVDKMEAVPAFCNDNASRTLLRLGTGRIIYGLALFYMDDGNHRLAEHVWRQEESGDYTDATYQHEVTGKWGTKGVEDIIYFKLFGFNLSEYVAIAELVMGKYYMLTAPKVEHFYHLEGYEKYFLQEQ